MINFDKNLGNSSVKCAKSLTNYQDNLLNLLLKNILFNLLLVTILLPIFHPASTFAMDPKMEAEAMREIIGECGECFKDQKTVNSSVKCARESINHQSDSSNLNQSIDLPTAYSLQPIASIRPVGRIITSNLPSSTAAAVPTPYSLQPIASIRPIGRIVTAQANLLRLANQIETVKQISREKRGEKKAYLWNCIITKLEQARTSWNKVSSQRNEERSTRWQEVAEASETAANGMMRLMQAYISLENKKVIKKLENKTWNAYYLSDASTCLLKSKEALKEATQIENGLLSKLASADEVQGVDGVEKFEWQELLDASGVGISSPSLRDAVETDEARRTKDFDAGPYVAYCSSQNSSPTQHSSSLSQVVVDGDETICSNTGATQQFAAEVELRKKSSEERDFWRNLAKQYKQAADYSIKASKVKKSQKNKWNASLALAGLFLQLEADYQVKAKEAEEAGKMILAAGYREAAKTSQQAADQYQISARDSLAIREKERQSLHWGGIACQAAAEYQVKASKAQEDGKAVLAETYREAARTLGYASDEYEQSVLDYVNLAYELAEGHYVAGKSLWAKVEYLVKAAEADEAGKTVLAASYKEAAVTSQSAERQYQEALYFYSEHRCERGHIFAKKGSSLQKKADCQAKASEAEESRNMILEEEHRNVAETGKLFKITPESFATLLKRKFTEIKSSETESSEDDSSDTDSTETDLSNTELNESESFERESSEEAKSFQAK